MTSILLMPLPLFPKSRLLLHYGTDTDRLAFQDFGSHRTSRNLATSTQLSVVGVQSSNDESAISAQVKCGVYDFHTLP